MKTTVLVAGVASGAPLLLGEPLSFWGGFDAASGRVVDRWHPDRGALLTGRVLMMEAGRGSSSGASVLAEAIRLGTAPAAILVRRRDAILATGALVAAELYGRAIPIMIVGDDRDWAACAAAATLTIGADGGIAVGD